MECKIIWNALSLEDWDARFRLVPRSTLLQSYPYAQAMRKVHQQGARHGLITLDGAEAGLVQIHEVSLFGKLVHAVSLDRGPAWLPGYGKPAHWAAFLAALDREFPRGFTRKRRLMPELTDTPAHHTLMTESPFKKDKNRRGYQTIWVDLTKDEATRRAALDRKWRGHLNKSEKQGLTLAIDPLGVTLPELMAAYIDDRLKKRYPGPSPKMVRTLAEFCVPRGECLIYNALHDGDMIAAILILVHGRAATYQIGWNGPMGRDCNAHHFLLWAAMNDLQARGITDFDLGGVNDEGAAAVKTFKQGLRGHEIALIGQYN